MLKVARLSVVALKALTEEARASRLSFADMVKRLAAQADTEPTFVSKKVRYAPVFLGLGFFFFF